jgi:hypothetical protein
MPERSDEILPGVTWGDWLDQIAETRRHPEANGLSKKLLTPVCQGGYCKRHGRFRDVTYQTETGLQLCSDCGHIWAARKFFNQPRELKDL